MAEPVPDRWAETVPPCISCNGPLGDKWRNGSQNGQLVAVCGACANNPKRLRELKIRLYTV